MVEKSLSFAIRRLAVNPEQPRRAGATISVSHVQRAASPGGVAPAMACEAGVDMKPAVSYQADCIFHKPAM